MAAALLPAQVTQIERLTAAGASARVVRQETGLPERAIKDVAAAWRRRKGIPPRTSPHQLSPDRIAQIEALGAAGASGAFIARDLDLSLETVGKFLRSWRARTGRPPFHHPPEKTARVERIIELATAGVSTGAIAREVGWSAPKVGRYISLHRKRVGAATLPVPRGCGTALEQGAVDAITASLRIGRSVRAAAREAGVSRATASRYAQAHLRSERSAGARCSCGRPAYHVGICARFVPTSALYVPSPAERASIWRRLERGALIRQINAATTVPAAAIKRELRRFLVDPIAAERRALCLRAQRPGSTPSDLLARQRDPLFAQISRMVSHSIDPALRDDIIADAYLAALEAGGTDAFH